MHEIEIHYCPVFTAYLLPRQCVVNRQRAHKPIDRMIFGPCLTCPGVEALHAGSKVLLRKLVAPRSENTIEIDEVARRLGYTHYGATQWLRRQGLQGKKQRGPKRAPYWIFPRAAVLKALAARGSSGALVSTKPCTSRTSSASISGSAIG